MKKRAAFIALLFMCMMILSGCAGTGYSSREKNALEAKGKKLAQAYLDERLPGAECLSAHAVTAETTDSSHLELTDYVSGRYRHEELTYDYYFNVNSGRMFTSNNFSFCRIHISENVYKDLGIEYDQVEAFTSAADYFLYLPDIPEKCAPIPVEAVPMEYADDAKTYIDDPDREDIFEVSMEICVDNDIELDFGKFSLDRFYNGAARQGIYFKNLTIHHTLSVTYDRIGYGGRPTIIDWETFAKRGDYIGCGSDTATYELWDDVKEGDLEAHKVVYRRTEYLEPGSEEIRVSEENFRQADTAEDQTFENEAYAKLSKEAYERFLNNQEPIYFDKWNLDGEWLDDEECYTNRFRENTPYRFEEVIDAFIQYMDINESYEFRMGRVEYAYIDCGADKIPELALRIADYRTCVGLFSDVYVIKLMENKLQLCYSFTYGYRTDARINEYGYIVDEGSTGAASFGRTEKFVNALGEEVFVFNVSAEYKQSDDLELALEAYSLKPFSEYTTYDAYEKDLINTYWVVDKHGDWIEDESTYPYCEYINDSSITYFSHAEVEDKLKEQKERLGITDVIVNGKEPEWTVLVEAPVVIEPVVIQNPGWEYYCDDSLTEASSHIRLEKISQEANDIIDEDDWFYSLGITMPGRSDQSYDDYYFHMYGDDELGYYHNMLAISDPDGNKIADLDFTEFYTPDYYYPADAMFVAEAIYSPKIVDGILYISAFHKTYAESAPHNGYIMAIDMNDDYKVLWKTEPLTCNAANFEIVGDTIICGYGFTNEDDFVYLLDKNTGKRIDTIKVKTGPEYFYAIDDKLYVRTYDTNYVFQITE